MLQCIVNCNILLFCLQGNPDPLNSAFHLTYNMVLNLLRVEEINPEYMLERSFYQFQNYASIPALVESMCMIVIAARCWGMVIFSVTSVCVTVCLVRTQTFENCDLETLFLVCTYIFRTSGRRSGLKVMESIEGHTHMWVISLRLGSYIVFFCLATMPRSHHHRF